VSIVKSASAAASSEPARTFQLERRRLDLRFRLARLTERQWLTSRYVRVRVGGSDLRATETADGMLPAFDSPGSDDHLRVFFPDEPPAALDATTLAALRAAPSREYTPLAWNSDDGWLDLEFALHPGDGLGSTWAANADLGSVVGIGGPRGATVITGRPGGWFLAGDETAVPAIRRFAHLMDADAVGRILIEVPGARHEIAIDAPPGVAVEQVHRAEAAAGDALAARLAALTAHDRPGGDVFAFIAAEQGVVRPGRELLVTRWGLDADRVVVKGYWKRGAAEYHAPH